MLTSRSKFPKMMRKLVRLLGYIENGAISERELSKEARRDAIAFAEQLTQNLHIR